MTSIHPSSLLATMDALCTVCKQIFTHNPDSPSSQTQQAADVTSSSSRHDTSPSTIAGGPHHSSAKACHDAAIIKACPICHSVWTKIAGLCTSVGVAINDPLDLDYYDNNQKNGLKPQSAFDTRWEAQLNGTDHNSQEHWSADQLVVRITFWGVCMSIGLDFANSVTHGHVDFALTAMPCDDTTQEECPSSHLSSHKVTSTTTSSDECWDQINHWIERCNNNCKCMQPSLKDNGDEDSYLPTRLLDVDKAHGNRIYLRLREDVIAQSGSNARYITLSHCWGIADEAPGYRLLQQDVPLLTNSGSRRPGIALAEATSDGIAVEKLPRTFRDAVDATRRLGCRYLWIDSLCILQDSKDDWEEVAGNMNLVYIKSLLTLAADGSTNSEGGLYKTRSPVTVNPTIVSPQWTKELCRGSDKDHNNDKDGDNTMQRYLLLPSDFWKNLVSESYLGRRSWCLQERLLSAAVIHFGESQLAFECRVWEACETFPNGLPKSLEDSYAHFKSFDFVKAGRALRERGRETATNKQTSDSSPSSSNTINDEAEDDELNRYYVWSRLVEKYARTDITRDSDKLVAIYGMAKVLRYLLDDYYLGGLWFKVVASQLLWTVDDGYHAVVIMGSNNDDDERKAQQQQQPDVGESSSGIQAPKTQNPKPDLRVASRTPLGQRPEAKNAPTWSWASVKGPIIMPTPLRKGALVDVKAFGDFGTTFKELRYHEDLILAISGSLHPGLFGYMARWGRWVLHMSKKGIGQDWRPRSDKTGTKGQQERQKHSDAADSGRQSIFEADMDLNQSVIGMVHLDTEQDMPPPEMGILNIVCLPVMDTRNCGKYALHRDPPFQLSGVSGLLLVKVGGHGGFYRRVGVFSLLGGFEVADLDILTPSAGKDKDMFFSDRGQGEDGTWRILLG